MHTPRQQDTYERALQRATDERLYATGPFPREGTRGPIGVGSVIRVYHPQQPGYYTVVWVTTWEDGEPILSCNCHAGEHGRMCKHRALAREHWLRWRDLGIDAPLAHVARDQYPIYGETTTTAKEDGSEEGG